MLNIFGMKYKTLEEDFRQSAGLRQVHDGEAAAPDGEHFPH
jgi:hypothetical protein